MNISNKIIQEYLDINNYKLAYDYLTIIIKSSTNKYIDVYKIKIIDNLINYDSNTKDEIFFNIDNADLSYKNIESKLVYGLLMVIIDKLPTYLIIKYKDFFIENYPVSTQKAIIKHFDYITNLESTKISKISEYRLRLLSVFKELFVESYDNLFTLNELYKFLDRIENCEYQKNIFNYYSNLEF